MSPPRMRGSRAGDGAITLHPRFRGDDKHKNDEGEAMRKIRCVLASLIMLLALGTAARADDAVELRIMTFNVWLGGQQVNIGRVFDAIRAAKADIVLLQE